MKRNAFFIGFALFTSFLFNACTKDEGNPVLPSITLSQDAGYIFENTTAAYGDTLRFGITVNSNGSDLLKRAEIFINGQQVADTNLNVNVFEASYYSIKGIADAEEWSFKATDAAGNSFTQTITITANFGAIDEYVTVLLGAQDNVATQSFLSLSNNAATRYMQAEAFQHQADIDMFCYYENTASHPNMMTLASPGANVTGIFTGATSPDNYTTKNLTWFVQTQLTAVQFDAVKNDAIVLDAYNPADQFKKAKVLTAGDVYAFMLQNGKYGLLKVIAVSGEATGTLEIAIKVQK